MKSTTGFYTRAHHDAQSYTFYPANSSDPAPLVVYIHGGAWRYGSKDSLKSSENGVHRLREFFSAAGFACASINYRLSSQAQFPAQIHDVKAAIAHFRKHATSFQIDPRKIVLVGGSAGGHLTMLAAATGTLGDSYYDGALTSGSSEVTCAVSIYGVSDLRTIYDDREICGFPRVHPEDDDAECLLLGSNFPAPAGSQAELNWSKAQPLDIISHASPAGTRRCAPLYLLHGLGDTCVPHLQSSRVYETLQQRGIETELYLIPDAEHADLRCYTDESLHSMVRWVQQQLDSKGFSTP
ncbi:esterase/lipase [Mycobacteroides abscessus subsp. abscessus]|nr:esterase/lipase [Mycobacteroides abscessus subsp. abscessus]